MVIDMDNITIGIPRSLFYYYYGNLWKKFLKNLGFNVIISPPTNVNIMNMGTKYAIDEMCLSLKNYIGHVAYLKDKCDYILIPRIDNFGRNDQTCTNFLAIYDIIKNLFDVNILNYNIDHTKKQYELDAFLSLGKCLHKSFSETMYAYEKAKIEDMNEKDKLIRKNIQNLKSEKIKILVVGHPYNIYDEMIGKPLLKLFNDEVELIYSNLFDEKKASSASKKLSKNLYFKYNKENIGAIELCKKDIDGIVFITSFPCGPDSITNELVIRKIKMPYLNLIVDDLDSLAGFETRIESFLDMIKERRKYEQNSISYDG